MSAPKIKKSSAFGTISGNATVINTAKKGDARLHVGSLVGNNIKKSDAQGSIGGNVLVKNTAKKGNATASVGSIYH